MSECEELRAIVARVEEVLASWKSGHEWVHHLGYVRELDDALHGINPTPEETR